MEEKKCLVKKKRRKSVDINPGKYKNLIFKIIRKTYWKLVERHPLDGNCPISCGGRPTGPPMMQNASRSRSRRTCPTCWTPQPEQGRLEPC